MIKLLYAKEKNEIESTGELRQSEAFRKNITATFMDGVE